MEKSGVVEHKNR